MNVNFEAEAEAQTITAPPVQGNGVVLRRGKIFHTGSWPSRGFSLTADEARAAVADFKPCDVDLEHKKAVEHAQKMAYRAELDGAI
jgi:hypothetical protein